MGDVFICKCGAVAECHPDIAGHLEYIECPECKLATPAIDTATMEGAAKLISTWEWLGGAVEYPEPVTAKESLAVRGLYAVFADNGNVICFSQLRSHASLLKLEAEGREVVTLVQAGQQEPAAWMFEGYILSSNAGEHIYSNPTLAFDKPYSTDRNITPLYAAAQPAPDTAALVEALNSMTCAYRSAISNGYDRITALGGECDGVERMLSDNPDYGKAKALIDAHRAQQGGAA